MFLVGLTGFREVALQSFGDGDHRYVVTKRGAVRGFDFGEHMIERFPIEAITGAALQGAHQPGLAVALR